MPLQYFRLGLATAPVLFASEQYPELVDLAKRRFNCPGDVDRAFQLVMESNGLEQTMFLAKSYGNSAIKSIDWLQNSKAKKELISLVEKAIHRTK